MVTENTTDIYENDNIEDEIEIIAENEIVGMRIDVFAYSKLHPYILSRNYAQKLIESGNIKVNGSCVKPNYKMRRNDILSCILPQPENITVQPENIPIDIVYEDSDILVVNKGRGMVVHPAPGNYSGTLVNALLYHCRDLSDINGIIRPGIVHRIDKDTTGLLVVAKNNAAHIFLSGLLKTHDIKREYIAVAEGIIPQNSVTVNLPIGRHPVDRKRMAVRTDGGKEAVTHFKVLKRLQGHTLVECQLETGRTHQIRVHLSHIGHAVAGDPVYGTGISHGMSGQALHAGKLSFIHPSSLKAVSFEAAPPSDFSSLVEGLSSSVSFTI